MFTNKQRDVSSRWSVVVDRGSSLVRVAALLSLCGWVCAGCTGHESKIKSQPSEHANGGADTAEPQSTGTDEATEPTGGDSAAHVCSRACLDHYFDGDALVTVERHEHAPSCGHAWDGEHWVEIIPCSIHAGHMCTEECKDHFREYDRITTIANHRHGPACGHLWDGADWLRVAKPGDD